MTIPINAHAMSAAEVAAALESDLERGLSHQAASRRLGEYGRNELPPEPQPSAFALFFKQFKSGLVLVLLGAAGLSFVTAHFTDAIAILLVVLVNAIVGFSQERRAEGAIAALKKMVLAEASVIRDGHVSRIDSASIVPGDVLVLNEGDRVPADARLLEAKELRANESALTGESSPSHKNTEQLPLDTPFSDHSNMGRMGTTITSGFGTAIVVRTGGNTGFGSIAGSLKSIRRERTPFERSVDRLAMSLGLLTIMLAAIVFVLGFYRGEPAVDIFFFAVAMAVAVIPEGLPAVLVVVLAIGVQAMAKRHAIVRHLPSVETLGATDVICTDKTGTLTENKLTVREVVTAEYAVRVSGEGWETQGEFLVGNRLVLPIEIPTLERLLEAAAICNHASVEWRDGSPTVIGDPTEAALMVLAAKAGIERRVLQAEYRIIDEIPFSSVRKYRAMLVEELGLQGQRNRYIYMVGAYGVLREASTGYLQGSHRMNLDRTQLDKFNAVNADMALRALRVLGIAMKRMPSNWDALGESDIDDMEFIGLVGMIDPPRVGVRQAIAACRQAGIRVIMSTGDQKDTAVAIGREVGLIDGNADLLRSVFTEKEVALMNEDAFRAALDTAIVFARVTPETKLRIVRELQRRGSTVAMTGDGVNDAPALKQASIGIAMGLGGTDVSREAADMVLADDNFVSIVAAVEEGRVVFRNFTQTTAYLLMTNMGEAATILACLLIGLPLPLLPAQVLWLNLVTDGFCVVALATERTRGVDVLNSRPRRRDAPVITPNTLILTLIVATLMCVGTLAVYFLALPTMGLDYSRSLAFVTLAMFQLWNVLNMRSMSASLFSIGLTTNVNVLAALAISLLLQIAVLYVPALSRIFKTRPISVEDWISTVLLTSSVFFVVEAYKVLIRRGIVPSKWM